MTQLNYDERLKLLRKIKRMAEWGISNENTLIPLENIQRLLNTESRRLTRND